MNRVHGYLKANVAKIAMTLAVVGILAHLLIPSMKFYKFVRLFLIFYIQDPLSSIMPQLQNSSKPNFLSIFFLVMLGVGGWHYKKSSGQDSRILKFCFSAIAIQQVLRILTLPISIMRFKKILASGESYGDLKYTIGDFIYPLIVVVPLGYMCFYLTKWLVRQGQPDFEVEENGKGKIKYIYPAVPKWTRFAHFVFDMYLMFIIIWPVVFNVGSYFFRDVFRSYVLLSNSSSVLAIVVAFSSIIYYLIFEGLFRATPLKFLTGTRVVRADDMQKPGFGVILSRTFCRRIPFDSLSFFWEKGWHDSVSNTEVVYEKKEGWVNFKQSIWIFLLVGMYILLNGYVYVNEAIDKARWDAVYNTVETYQDKSTLNNLNAGDLLLFDQYNGRYDDDQMVVVVSQVSDQEIIGNQFFIGYRNETSRRIFMQKGGDSSWKSRGEVALNKSKVLTAFINRSRSPAFELGEATYTLKSIVDVDTPVFTAGYANQNTTGDILTANHTINYDATEVEILSLEVLEGDLEWENEFPKATQFDLSRRMGSFNLNLESKGGAFSKTRMSVRYHGEDHTYLIFRNGLRIQIVQEVEK